MNMDTSNTLQRYLDQNWDLREQNKRLQGQINEIIENLKTYFNPSFVPSVPGGKYTEEQRAFDMAEAAIEALIGHRI